MAEKKKLSFTVTPPAEDTDNVEFVIGAQDSDVQNLNPTAPVAKPIEPTIVQKDESLSVIDPEIAGALGMGETLLSIASGIAGATLGAANATLGLAKNLADYTVFGGLKLTAWPIKGMLPHLYDQANDLFIQSLDAIPEDLQKDFHVWATPFTYEPRTDEGKRYVMNVNKGLETARTTIGDFAAGIPRVDPNSKDFEVQSMEELKALSALDDSPEGMARKALGALGQSSIDLVLLAIGGKIGKGVNPVVKLESPKATEILKQGTMAVEQLDALPNSKPKFKNVEEAQARLDELATGEAKQQIVIETKDGVPQRVLSGQDMILAIKELRRQGQDIPEAPVHLIEESMVKQLDNQLAMHAAKAFQADERATQALVESAHKSLVDRLATGLLDQKATVKRELVIAHPEIGREAVKHLELAQGATQRAILYQTEAWNRIYKDISDRTGSGAEVLGETVKTERELFDRFVRAQRIISLEKSAAGKARQPRFEAGTNAKEMSNWLQSLKDSIGDERFAELALRTTEYFKVSREVLDRYLEEGIITPEKHKELRQVNYVKTDFVEDLDPITDYKVVNGEVVAVGESGIQPLSKSKTKSGVIIDSEALLNELLIRAENRISRNRAGQQLVLLAKRAPANTVAKIASRDKTGKIKPPPKDYGLVRVMIDGKEEGIYMPAPLAEQWKFADPQISAGMANAFRIMSGTALLKPLATGYNPAFVLSNIPRDLVHVQLATSGIYSPHPPIFLIQIARDIATIAKDSATFSGRYRKYIDEGGGQELLAHQGRDLLMHSYEDISIRHRPVQKRLKGALGYANEQSELLVRLAIRERVLRNQREKGLPEDPYEATWQARRYLDFAQGGSMTKAFDNIVPYTNVAVQAFKTISRNAKENPREFALKASWVMALYGAWHARNYLYYKETMDQIPEDVKARNLIIPTKNFIIDEFGNKRYEYYTVAKDPSVIPLTFWLERWTEKYMTGEAPTDSGLQYMTQTLPGLSGIPTINAFWTYQSDYNPWYNDDIFGRDLNIEDYAKFRGYPGTPTPEVFKDFGELFNVKPEALAQASRQIVPNNFYLQIAGAGYDAWFGQLDPRAQSMLTEERLTKTPAVNRVYHLTHPAAKELDDMDRKAKQINTPTFLTTQELDGILYKAQLSGDYEPALKFAEGMAETDPLLAQDFVQRTKGSIKLDQIFKSSKEEFGYMPASKYWWLGLLRQPSRVRAEVYFEKWHSMNTQRERDWLDSTAAALSSGDLNFVDQEFAFFLEKLKNERNTELLKDKE